MDVRSCLPGVETAGDGNRMASVRGGGDRR
jgi:hypothetical protein